MEKRRAARVDASIYIALEGIDDQLVLRRGNISASGLYLELMVPIGTVGTVQWLRLASHDRLHSVAVMAHVARTLIFTDVARGTRYGVALEFMPESDSASNTLQEFVLYVVARKLSSAAMHAVKERTTSAPTLPVPDTPSPELRVQAVVLEATTPLTEGMAMDVALRPHAPAGGAHKALRFHGRLGTVAQIGVSGQTMYRSRIELTEVPPSDPEEGAYSEEELSDWMTRYVVDPETPRSESRGHFEGLLARIKLPTILSLMEMDRMTGVLQLAQDRDVTRVHVREGRVLDVSSTLPGEPRALLRVALGWNAGGFEFIGGPIDREDRLGTTMTALILDLAREEDEERRR